MQQIFNNTNRVTGGLVSIIIPNRNYARWLPKCIESCLAQTWPHVEIIVVDDASTDQSIEVLQKFKDRIRIVSLKDQHGPAHARNVGFELARGDFIQFLDSDDYLLSDKIERQYHLMTAEESDICLSSWRDILYCFSIILPMPRVQLPTVSMLLPETIRDRRWFPLMACLFRRDVIERTGVWNTALSWNEDRDYRFRLLSNIPKVSVLDEAFLIYRRHSRNTRGNMPETEQGKRSWREVNHSFYNLVRFSIDSGNIPSEENAEALMEFAQKAEVHSVLETAALNESSSLVIKFDDQRSLPIRVLSRIASNTFSLLRVFPPIKNNYSLLNLVIWIEAWLRYVWSRLGFAKISEGIS